MFRINELIVQQISRGNRYRQVALESILFLWQSKMYRMQPRFGIMGLH
jgi:hypothetical protein